MARSALSVGRHRGSGARAALVAACLSLLALSALLSHLALLALSAPALAQASGPQRIVSINQCADELLLRLADRDRIASVTYFSRDAANSNVTALGEGIPVNHGLAEEIMSYRPDVVLAGAYSSQTAVQVLRRLGVRVVAFDAPRTMDDVRAQIRGIAAAIGEPARGEAMVREIDAGLAAFPPPAPPLRAIVMQPNGFTVDKGSLVEELMKRAGLDNLASRIEAGSYLSIPLEAVALQEADVMILNGEVYDAPSLATEALNHPIIAALGRRLKVISIAPKLWTCAGPNLVDAVRSLIAQTRGAGAAMR